jgi:hypothetical protein
MRPLSAAPAIVIAFIGCAPLFNAPEYAEHVQLDLAIVSGAQLDVLDGFYEGRGAAVATPKQPQEPFRDYDEGVTTLADDIYLAARVTNHGGRTILGYKIRLTAPRAVEGIQVVVVARLTSAKNYAVQKVSTKGMVIGPEEARELATAKVEYELVSLQVK